MVIKQALLDSEIELVKTFLARFDLGYDIRATETLYAEEDGKIVGTVSRTDHLIECLAVDQAFRGENLAGQLVGEILSSLRAQHVFHYLVFTKAIYAKVFESMNFRTLATTGTVAILEAGSGTIEAEIAILKKKIESRWPISWEKEEFGAIVVNCNPMTEGHYRLIETAAQKHRRLIVFVVEEDRSMFSFQERFTLVFLALKPLENVIVVPSTPYIVSHLTFPSYFLKSMDEREEEHARLDALIFKNYFMKELHIAKRYVGTESDLFMIKYNAILKTALGNRLEIIPRFQKDGITISASIVRSLILQNRVDEALLFVPEATRSLLRAIAEEKYAFSVR
jgi:[citrate (pro-3S)-lyase] ligase